LRNPGQVCTFTATELVATWLPDGRWRRLVVWGWSDYSKTKGPLVEGEPFTARPRSVARGPICESAGYRPPGRPARALRLRLLDQRGGPCARVRTERARTGSRIPPGARSAGQVTARRSRRLGSLRAEGLRVGVFRDQKEAAHLAEPDLVWMPPVGLLVDPHEEVPA
jgi:hypothetical protein